MPPVPASDNPVDIAAAYIRYMDRFSTALGWPPAPERMPAQDVDEWAANLLNSWSLRDAVTLWPVIIELIDQAVSLEQLAYIAAGPVEDLLVHTGDRFVDSIRAKADTDPRWAFAVACTYPDRMTDRGRHLVEYWREPGRHQRLPREARRSLRLPRQRPN